MSTRTGWRWSPRSAGDLRRGDILVSNFNNAQNQQGTGSSIVEISPSGRQHVFAVVPPPTPTPAVGLTTALSVLHSGFVIVGSLPAPQGDVTQATAGALTVLDSQGNVVETLRAPDINGPWDMTAVDFGRFAVLFVTNVLNQTVDAGGQVVNDGTVVRIVLDTDHGVPRVLDNQVIATGFGEHTDPSALVVGPTGVGLGRHDVLYVADSNGNRIAAVPHALIRRSVLGGGGVTVSQGGALNDPLGLAIAPNGDIVTANGGDGQHGGDDARRDPADGEHRHPQRWRGPLRYRRGPRGRRAVLRRRRRDRPVGQLARPVALTERGAPRHFPGRGAPSPGLRQR